MLHVMLSQCIVWPRHILCIWKFNCPLCDVYLCFLAGVVWDDFKEFCLDAVCLKFYCSKLNSPQNWADVAKNWTLFH